MPRQPINKFIVSRTINNNTQTKPFFRPETQQTSQALRLPILAVAPS